MRSIESEGDTIDEAIDNALRALELERDRVQIEIVSDATRGIFGFGGKKARIRATVRTPLSSRLGEDDFVEGARLVSRETVKVQAGQAPSRAATDAATERPARPVSKPRGSAAPGTRPTPAATAVRQETAVPADLESRCKGLAGELLRLVGVSCELIVRPGVEAGEIVLDVTGDSGGLLIGRRGQTLDALEYVINRMVGRADEGGALRIVLDVEGYRERRRQYLETLANRLAEKARQTGRVVTLNPMSPRDRRIVHLALHDDATVSTRSQGEGHYRRMLILPADRAQRGPRSAGPPR
jgi:spoIIIJ-associated protein